MSNDAHTFLNFAIEEKIDLKKYILRQLGAPLLTVQLTEEHLDDCINDATELFTKYVNLEQEFKIIPLSGYNSTEGGIRLNGNVVGIFSIDPNYPYANNIMGYADGVSLGGALLHTVYTSQAMGLLGSNGFYNDGAFSFGTQANISNFRALARVMRGKGYDFSYSPRTQMLKLWPEPDKASRRDHSVILGVNVIPNAELTYGEDFVKKYATARAKILLGRIRSTYKNVRLPGGGEVDGSELISEGKEEIEKLEDNLMNNECKPIAFFVG